MTEVKTTLAGLRRRFVCDVVERSTEHAVVLYRMRGAATVHGVEILAGSLSVGYFWRDRPYNVYHWLTPAGRTLAHYVNVGDVTAYDGAVIEWHDLAVDVLATPDGRVRVLDEDELPPDLDPALRRHVEDARDRVLRDLPTLIEQTERRSRAVVAALAE
jgi:predicted RNA-binding protein associated with RNAse of E/G family